MNDNKSGVFIADTAIHTNGNKVSGQFVKINEREFYRIGNYDSIPPFFINIVSSSDHWMFISSSGGITAGRVDADNALFPYYTVDKITENHECVGHKTIFLTGRTERMQLWEPFVPLTVYRIERNLYKSICGDEIIFEEINHDIRLSFRYSWKTSEKYGFVLKAELKNMGDDEVSVRLLSGLLDILPWGVSADMQRRLSNLLDAYKLAELEQSADLGIFGFSAKVTDLAEPSESLKATTVWQHGIENAKYLLSARQLNDFRYRGKIEQESRVQGERGAFMVNGAFDIEAGEQKSWVITAEVNQDHSSVVGLKNQLVRSRTEAVNIVQQDCIEGTRKLRKIIGGADGLQMSNDELSSVHHFANTLYNTMRGGTFYNNYHIYKSYFLDYLQSNNKDLTARLSGFIEKLPEVLTLPELCELADKFNSPSLSRLCRQYLPLYFSRRHGDPSRPWNKFSIRLKADDGTYKLDYEGNWRDIFQNWEALALAYPEYIENMIFRFLNATTADGYNPYRIHLTGVDWEKPDPNDPWSNIGYWSDHQIIYLQKLLELSLKFHPALLHKFLGESVFVHTDIPYRIKSYSSILKDPFETIEFDEKKDRLITKQVQNNGSDGQLVACRDGKIVYSNMMEKLIILLLAKMSNFIPGGGLWMNTQRPEWNDANNALAGKGLSVVSVCYMRRYLAFLIELLEKDSADGFSVSVETHSWLKAIGDVLDDNRGFLVTSFDRSSLKAFMDGAGQAADDYRRKLYSRGLSDKSVMMSRSEISAFLTLALEYIDSCISLNKRGDGLYHAYNVLSYDDTGADVKNLYEMLEGQVAVLSSGMLKPEECLDVLKALRCSKMYRADQNSYILYPDRLFPGFLSRNTVAPADAEEISLITELRAEEEGSVITADEEGNYHFNGIFHNVKDLSKALDKLRKDERFRASVQRDSAALEALFTRTFNHEEFTGRSGTFFGYEGLGSIYWHMVSKLLLAAQEAAVHSFETGKSDALTAELIDAYYDIRSGIGFNKSPEVYGAFPTDPYSHTPAGKGAKQPGMTGQVKEEIITRLAELGVYVKNGEISFTPFLLRTGELMENSADFVYHDISGTENSIELGRGELAFTFCQVPFIVRSSERDRITVKMSEGEAERIDGNILPAEYSRSIFSRNGRIVKVTFESSKIAMV